MTGPNGKTFPTTGILDSGADVSLFPADWAEPLGIQIADCEVVAGGSAQGSSDYHVWNEPIRATLLGKTIDLHAIFGGYSEVLLGREDFFDHFRLTIEHRKRRFFLEPLS